jgi:hypothetical protein
LMLEKRVEKNLNKRIWTKKFEQKLDNQQKIGKQFAQNSSKKIYFGKC